MTSVRYIFPLQLPRPSAALAAAPAGSGSCGSSIGSTTRSRASPVSPTQPTRGHSTWFTKSKNGIRSINQMMYSMLRLDIKVECDPFHDERVVVSVGSRKSSSGTRSYGNSP
ncbi:hypothetical protein Bca52824_043179 [Brassica carinata]|uniref:Uncharacterized protein n=1 Tax=Brassica carinata TaxID=52824 RepID=A0A8X7RY20_BRACI|nr:hypothetical protein Bca52824_043179 [Brassica carinata]